MKLRLKINQSAAIKILNNIPKGCVIKIKVGDANKILGKSK